MLTSPHDGDRAVAQIAVAGDQPDLGVIYLRSFGLSSQLSHQFDDVIHAGHMGLGVPVVNLIGLTADAESRNASVL
jgi:hypothetical protein